MKIAPPAEVDTHVAPEAESTAADLIPTEIETEILSLPETASLPIIETAAVLNLNLLEIALRMLQGQMGSMIVTEEMVGKTVAWSSGDVFIADVAADAAA